MTTSNTAESRTATPSSPEQQPERDVESRLSEALDRIAVDARKEAARYARDTEVPEGGE